MAAAVDAHNVNAMSLVNPKRLTSRRYAGAARAAPHERGSRLGNLLRMQSGMPSQSESPTPEDNRGSVRRDHSETRYTTSTPTAA